MGKVRLLKREELSPDWQPESGRSHMVWEVMQRLIHALNEQGEQGAATILRATGTQGEMARDLAYRLYTVCERKGWAAEAQVYNALVLSWPQISQLARHSTPEAAVQQISML